MEIILAMDINDRVNLELALSYLQDKTDQELQSVIRDYTTSNTDALHVMATAAFDLLSKRQADNAERLTQARAEKQSAVVRKAWTKKKRRALLIFYGLQPPSADEETRFIHERSWSMRHMIDVRTIKSLVRAGYLEAGENASYRITPEGIERVERWKDHGGRNNNGAARK